MKRNEQGIALVITLFLMAALSALAVSLTFLSQTETASSRNYRTMSQARYGGEAGVHKAINYLMYSYSAPASPYTGLDLTKSPVTCTSTSSGCTTAAVGTCDGSTVARAVSTGCIVLSGMTGVTSNYPDTAVKTAFAAAAHGTLALNASGTTTNTAMGSVNFGVAAILISMRSLDLYGGGSGVIQTWKVVSDGTIAGAQPATVEVTSMLERTTANAQTYAVFATDPSCGAITISGNASTDSYNSATMSTLPPPATGTSGGIGTNGNLNVSGSVGIGGTLSTPRTGAGTCSNSNPNAITGTGSWTYGGTNHLSQSVTFPSPTAPSGVPTSSSTISSGMGGLACTTAVAGSGWTCSISGNTVTLTPGVSGTLTLGNLTVGSNTNLVIAGGSLETLNVNSFALGSNATMTMSNSPNTTVTMNIAGQSLGSSLPLDLTGGGNVNTGSGPPAGSYDPSRLQIVYAGTGEIDLVGNNSIAATIYAPNALAKTTGHGSLYGSILSSRFTDTGGATVNYDTNLSTKYQTLGNFVMTSFTWKKY